jgi:mannose-6-phosphate isomerase
MKMEKIAPLQNTVQDYAWGSKTAIAELLGQPVPAETPQAELWMGTHPKAPSRVLSDGHWRSLPKVIEDNPEEVLGKRVAKRFAGRLPFLFKVLAAAKPLSIQAHPDLAQARQGFARENKLGIPLDAPQRNYKDDNHKPEIICALTPFWALNGFRKIEEIIGLLERLQVHSLRREIDTLRTQPNSEGLRAFFHDLMILDEERRGKVLSESIASAEPRTEEDPLCHWMIKLNQEYPGDIGVLSAALLNLIRLEPGEAMCLPAGELHAYLEGVGIELMANSDNVLRGGLTPKHVDVQELLKILSFTAGEVDILAPQSFSSGEVVYPTPAKEFVLSVIAVEEDAVFRSKINRSVEIMLCTEGEAEVKDTGDESRTRLTKGTSIVIPAAVERYLITGKATLYRAAVPT